MTPRIVSIGDLVLDIIMPSTFPVRGGEHQNLPERRIEPGGSANFIIAARNLGIEVSAAGAVGDDVYGTQILAPLRARGVDVANVVVSPGSTSTLVVTLTDRQSSEHVFLGSYGDGPEIPYPEGLDASIEQADALFLSGYTLVEKRIVAMTLRAVDYAHHLGKPIYMDVGPLWKMADEEHVKWVLKHVYLLLLTADEASLVTDETRYEQAYADLLLEGPTYAVVKTGAQGCMIVTRDWWFQVPAFEVDRVVDTVGAGDTFDAAFMAGLLNGLEMRECALLANAMGAASTMKIGAGTNAPTCAEVMAVLDKAGEKVNFTCSTP
jgi:sugar/nucleoside kinase (ribokinase family)